MFVNARRMCARVMVLSLFVCVYVLAIIKLVKLFIQQNKQTSRFYTDFSRLLNSDFSIKLFVKRVTSKM